jgi:glutaminase
MSNLPPSDDLDLLVNRVKSAASPLRETLTALHERYRDVNDGVVASYIPELALADPKWFGIVIASTTGQVVEIGDWNQTFTIQSVSKPFVYGLALESWGREAVMEKVAVEPSGDPFNSIVLHEQSNRPFNPMVNAGAIATADLIPGDGITERSKRLLGAMKRFIGHDIYVDPAVFTSERSTGHRNRAIAHLMLNFDMVKPRVDETLELYFQQCSVLVNCRDLAVMGATLANGGVNPITSERAISQMYIRDVLSVMLSCGMYDFSGEWAYRVGLPAKSGVSGGVLAVIPGRGAIAVYSPPLDARGNSVRAIKVCEDLVNQFGLHSFDSSQLKDDFFRQLQSRR